MSSWKDDFILKRGKDAYKKMLARQRAYHKVHKEENNARVKRYYEEHPESVIAKSQEQGRKGGKRYKKTQEYNRTGLRGERNAIRTKHRFEWLQYKKIIAPDSQIHHSWRRNSAEYDGVALVERDKHMHGFIDVIQILEGEITLFTEKEIAMQEELRAIGEEVC